MGFLRVIENRHLNSALLFVIQLRPLRKRACFWLEAIKSAQCTQLHLENKEKISQLQTAIGWIRSHTPRWGSPKRCLRGLVGVGVAGAHLQWRIKLRSVSANSALPPQHNIVEGETKIRVRGNDLGHLDLNLDLLVVCLSLTLQVHHLQRIRRITGEAKKIEVMSRWKLLLWVKNTLKPTMELCNTETIPTSLRRRGR